MSNLARALIGQGLMMGWGDEAEAWLRSKLGDKAYEQELAKIRGEYGKYSEESPFISGAAEFAGGALPGIGMMLIPGGQVAGAAQLARGLGATMGRTAAAGATTGAVAGAGSAEESRLGGALGGALLGGTFGAAVPAITRAGGSGKDWLMERLAPTAERVERRALDKFAGALREAEMKPQDVAARIARDRSLRVPSVVANVDPRLTDLADVVAQRTGRGAGKVEQALTAQKLGARERAYSQVRGALKPGDYYGDEQKMMDELRQKASAMYDQAYAAGPVDDPRINEVLKTPAFAGFFQKAKQIADMEATAAKLRGEDPSKYQLPELHKLTLDADGKVVDMDLVRIPDVRTLDYIKRGIDATIDSGFRGQGMSTAEAQALKQLRNQLVAAIDENVPAYQAARAAYAGDMEVLDAMHIGMNEFGKMDHEQVVAMVSKMNPSELDALRTGVARGLYGTIMAPSGNFNAAQRIIGSPEMQAKLQPLFENPGQFRLFKAAMEREAQLFHQANKILGGSQTKKRVQMERNFEDDGSVGDALRDIVTGGWWNSLTNATRRFIRSTEISEQTADKLADMLTAKDPAAVATVVRLLEQQQRLQAPKALKAGAAEMGLTTGTASAFWPPPVAPEEDSNP